MRTKFKPKFHDLRNKVTKYQNKVSLPGLATNEHLDCFVRQLIDSLRRTEYVVKLRCRDVSPKRLVPSSSIYDPIRAAIYYLRDGDIENACWQIFLSTHFGFHKIDKWKLPALIYGSLGGNQVWDWQNISANFDEFAGWYKMNQLNVKGRFGNHRKYQSLKTNHLTGTFGCYIDCIVKSGSHHTLLKNANKSSQGSPTKAFDYLYKSISNVKGFGRTACFDYLCMLKKTGIAMIEPGIPYMTGATGPMQGAKLLLDDNNLTASELDDQIACFGQSIKVGMQEMEDAICNWQKNPSRYEYFGG